MASVCAREGWGYGYTDIRILKSNRSGPEVPDPLTAMGDGGDAPEQRVLALDVAFDLDGVDDEGKRRGGYQLSQPSLCSSASSWRGYWRWCAAPPSPTKWWSLSS